MEKTIAVTFKLRGTEEEIKRMKTRIGALVVCNEVVSMHIREVFGVWGVRE